MTKNTDLAKLTPEQTEIVSVVIQQVVGPVMEHMAKLFSQNAEAIEQIAGTLKVQTDRIESLEKQIRLNTLVTPKQVSYINDAIRSRSRELLQKRDIEDRRSVQRLGNAIRKSVLTRYGVAALNEIPKHEYSVALAQVGMWNDALCLRDVVKEARERAESEA